MQQVARTKKQKLLDYVPVRRAFVLLTHRVVIAIYHQYTDKPSQPGSHILGAAIVCFFNLEYSAATTVESQFCGQGTDPAMYRS